MTTAQQTRLDTVWQAIESAGSINAYVRQQLQQHGYLVERRHTDGMSKSELDKYKKELKQEAAEQRRLKQEAWQAYKSKHIVHLGEGIYWSDDSSEDQWDTPMPTSVY